jgi:cyclopropane-fatty-acyl-phospholipid synthase
MTTVERLGLWVFRRLARQGTLELTLPDGSAVIVGSGSPEADLRLHSHSTVSDMIRRGLLGFAEGYMSGAVDTSDLRRLLAWGVANQRSWFEHPAARWTLPIRRLWQRIIPEWRHDRVRSMNDHYNLGNGFYQSWLDETMTYSSARFATPEQDLADAQRNKYEAIADGAGIEPGMRVLEIGCGWGGFAEYAALHRDCDVVAITLSEEQAAYARQRMENAGLTNRVEIGVKDFREVVERFDAVVSIEMIESVDESPWGPLFATLSRSLNPGALASMQVITIQDAEWESYRSRADFIQQYIFPGGQLPAPKILRRLSREANLSVEKVETFGLDYARTLETWKKRFDSSWPDIEATFQLDERFRRMWELYLALCEAGFRMGRINVEQWVFSSEVVAA